MKRGSSYSNKRKYRRGGGDNGVDTTITGNIDNIDMDDNNTASVTDAMPAASVTDASVTDASVTDSSVTDASVTDASVTDASVTDASGNSGWFSGLKNLFGGRKRSSKKSKRVHFRLSRGGRKSVKKIKCVLRGKLKKPTKKRTCKRKPGRKCSKKN